MNKVKMLPDSYEKSDTSNNYKLLQLADLLFSDLQSDFESIIESGDIQKATGKTLDYYGDIVGQERNGYTDEQYRVKILNKIARSMSGCDVNSFIKSVSQMLDIDSSLIHVIEGDMYVTVYGIPSDVTESTGLTIYDISSMIQSVLPAGVGLVRQAFNGTLIVRMYSKYITDGSGFIISSPTLDKYPQLFQAWRDGQKEFSQGNDVGLSGYGEVPSAFLDLYPTYNQSGTYSGGTLGILSGE